MDGADDRLTYFSFPILFPEDAEDEFAIFGDLADVMGVDYSADAVQRILDRLAQRPIAGLGPDRISWEADRVSIRAKSPEVILEVACLVNELATSGKQVPLSQRIRDDLRRRLRNAVR